MIQLTILNGKQAGSTCVARRFPFSLGRSPKAQLRLEEDGVWDTHAQIHFRRGEGFLLEVSPGALAAVNGQPLSEARLRNGDLIECGSAKVRFWLAPLRQRSLRAREGLTWVALAGLCLAQLLIIYRLVG